MRFERWLLVLRLRLRSLVRRARVEDDLSGSHAYWERRFARAPDIVGRRFVLNGITYDIIGVAPSGPGIDREQARAATETLYQQLLMEDAGSQLTQEWSDGVHRRPTYERDRRAHGARREPSRRAGDDPA